MEGAARRATARVRGERVEQGIEGAGRRFELFRRKLLGGRRRMRVQVVAGVWRRGLGRR